MSSSSGSGSGTGLESQVLRHEYHKARARKKVVPCSMGTTVQITVPHRFAAAFKMFELKHPPISQTYHLSSVDLTTSFLCHTTYAPDLRCTHFPDRASLLPSPQTSKRQSTTSPSLDDLLNSLATNGPLGLHFRLLTIDAFMGEEPGRQPGQDADQSTHFTPQLSARPRPVSPPHASSPFCYNDRHTAVDSTVVDDASHAPLCPPPHPPSPPHCHEAFISHTQVFCPAISHPISVFVPIAIVLFGNRFSLFAPITIATPKRTIDVFGLTWQSSLGLPPPLLDPLPMVFW
ncbi:hypothetical protein JB92DRAFT_3115422 [Gautieria morchelliformis]|nr:hypothetical protein JB92DRAFT_3115422 [Gautieria morchelliformis]